MLSRSRTTVGLLCGWLVLTSVGCATMKMPFGKDRIEKASIHNPVTQILCLWEPSEGRDPQGLPCRGFAGQILFLASRGSLPVEIEGDVRVYVFDDQGTQEEQAKPIHQFDFDAGTWKAHLTKGALGPAYSVFIPYTRHGSHEANCALRVRMKSKDFPVVFSDLCSIQLIGHKRKNSAEANPPTLENSDSPNGADPAIEAAANALRRTTTISLDGNAPKPLPTGKTSGAIQLAAHEDVDESKDPNAIRIQQLESLVQQLLEKQSASQSGRQPVSPEPASPLPVDDTAKPLSTTSNSGPRFQLSKPSAPQLAISNSSNSEVQSTDIQHPFHDLAIEDKVKHRHPLADLEDDSAEGDANPRRKPQPVVRTHDENASPPRIIRASEEQPNSVREESDPFDPIDTEAIETTAVESNQTIRRRLRAASR